MRLIRRATLICRDGLRRIPQRVFATLALAINLEHIGDIVVTSLMNMAARRISKRRRPPPIAPGGHRPPERSGELRPSRLMPVA